jgi:DNA-binding transcriptional regulator YhcF (GntR family)
MEFEFMTADTVLPPCMPLPAAMLRLPISSTAKVMYARLLDATLAGGAEDTNGILFVRFPIVELAAALSRSSVTVKRSLKELEDAGLILRAWENRTAFTRCSPRRRAAVMNEKLEKLNRQLAQGEARLRRAQHEEKILAHQIKQLTRKERTHRLCTRGAMLESFLIRPEVLTDDDVMDILKQAFSQTGMKETVAESVKQRVAEESLTE